MTKVRVRGLKSYFEPKTRKVYTYHRTSGLRLHAPIGTPEFFAEYHRAEASVRSAPAARPGSLGLVIEQYRASHVFQTLKPRTQKDYELVLTWLRPLWDLPIRSITPGDIVAVRDRAFEKKRRSFANYTVAVLSIVFAFAVERGLTENNPCRDVKKIRRREDERRYNRPWTRDELEVVFVAAPRHLALPLHIARWTGLRQGDVLRLAPTAYDGQFIMLKTAKRGVEVKLPVARPLKGILDEHLHRGAVTLCTNSRGCTWTSNGFRASLFKLLRALEKEGRIGSGLTFHGLRHTVATELRELGFDARTIADMLGQRTEAMANHYSREADVSAKMTVAVSALEANAQRTRVSRKGGEPV